MKFYLKNRKGTYDATAKYDVNNHTFVVLKGSVVSKEVSKSPKFRSAKSIGKYRDGNVVEQIVQSNITFRSASTAANFVTGTSTNGCLAWKDKDGNSFKKYLESRI